jgi:hypothetical protein
MDWRYQPSVRFPPGGVTAAKEIIPSQIALLPRARDALSGPTKPARFTYAPLFYVQRLRNLPHGFFAGRGGAGAGLVGTGAAGGREVFAGGGAEETGTDNATVDGDFEGSAPGDWTEAAGGTSTASIGALALGVAAGRSVAVGSGGGRVA